jgi:fructose-1,6-bisphosphatase II / sedoheptulose-1,7-bisphosphatase
MIKRNLSSFSNDIIQIVENAAIACYDWIGKGQEKLADQAAVTSMRSTLNEVDFQGTVVIGEGERDQAPMLYIGEKVGKNNNGLEVDIALDPLEGTTICANGAENSLAVIALASKGGFLHAPDVYMDKIAIGPNLPFDVVDLDNSLQVNLSNLAKAKKCSISDLTILILKRERHKELIAKAREAGARVKLISDGDVAGVIACTDACTKIDAYMGIGGAPEGVLAAAALRVVGGQMWGRLIFDQESDQNQIKRAKEMGIIDLHKKYHTTEMAKGDVIFACAGVTDGYMLKGVKKHNSKIIVNSLIMDSSLKRIRKITTEKNLV